jgi:hypothetical protein
LGSAIKSAGQCSPNAPENQSSILMRDAWCVTENHQPQVVPAFFTHHPSRIISATNNFPPMREVHASRVKFPRIRPIFKITPRDSLAFRKSSGWHWHC